MQEAAYTKSQRKSYVRAALREIERLGDSLDPFKRGLADRYRAGIARFVPKGRDPLDWATEP